MCVAVCVCVCVCVWLCVCVPRRLSLQRYTTARSTDMLAHSVSLPVNDAAVVSDAIVVYIFSALSVRRKGIPLSSLRHLLVRINARAVSGMHGLQLLRAIVDKVHNIRRTSVHPTLAAAARDVLGVPPPTPGLGVGGGGARPTREGVGSSPASPRVVRGGLRGVGSTKPRQGSPAARLQSTMSVLQRSAAQAEAALALLTRGVTTPGRDAGTEEQGATKDGCGDPEADKATRDELAACALPCFSIWVRGV